MGSHGFMQSLGPMDNKLYTDIKIAFVCFVVYSVRRMKAAYDKTDIILFFAGK